jgi:hypothetical protein
MQNINYSTTSSDLLTDLPSDKIQPSHEELQLVNMLFKQHNSTMYLIFNEAKEALFVGILFILFSIPQLDDLIKKFIPIANNSIYFLIIIKALLLMLLFWLIKHFYLAKKN